MNKPEIVTFVESERNLEPTGDAKLGLGLLWAKKPKEKEKKEKERVV